MLSRHLRDQVIIEAVCVPSESLLTLFRSCYIGCKSNIIPDMLHNQTVTERRLGPVACVIVDSLFFKLQVVVTEVVEGYGYPGVFP